MILIGQFDSPFVRRVGITARHYGIAFEHRPWSVFGNGEEVRRLNPLMRVPTMVLDDGEVLVDSATMIDHLDAIAPTELRLAPGSGAARRQVLRIAALANGMAEKAVSLFYEIRLHKEVSAVWSERCRSQMLGTLEALEAERARAGAGYWFGDRLSHADVAVATAVRFVSEAHPALVDLARFPALGAATRSLEDLPLFREISQPFIAPA